ncbi:hypothetical protein CapIbe_009456, partial [Capra ibex]
MLWTCALFHLAICWAGALPSGRDKKLKTLT